MPVAGKPLRILAEAISPEAVAQAAILETLLAQMGVSLADLVGGKPVLDAGGSALGALLDSLGCTVVRETAVREGMECGLALVGEASQLERAAAVADYAFFAGLGEGEQWRVEAEAAAGGARHALLRRADLFTNGQLVEGWYPAEGPRNGWRWTRNQFVARFATPRPGTLWLSFYAPEERLRGAGKFTVGLIVAGELVGRTVVTEPGMAQAHAFIQGPGMGAHNEETSAETEVLFWISPTWTMPGDERSLGVIAHQALFLP